MKEIAFTDVPLTSRPAPKVWQVITEQVVTGQAVILQQDDGAYAVQFPDEPEPLPFDYLTYSKQLGLYDVRQFPNWSDE